MSSALQGGWGGVVWKTLVSKAPVVYVTAPPTAPSGAAESAPARPQQYRVITDPDLQTNMRELKQ